MNPSGNPPHLRRAGTKIEKRGEDKGIGFPHLHLDFTAFQWIKSAHFYKSCIFSAITIISALFHFLACLSLIGIVIAAP